jgi:hypothetical protein
VGNGNIDVDSATATRKSGQPVVQDLSDLNGSELRIDPSPKIEHQTKGSRRTRDVCGAMSQQGSEFRGNVSAPQQFVHLVGCRDRKIGSGPEARQYPNPLKR